MKGWRVVVREELGSEGEEVKSQWLGKHVPARHYGCRLGVVVELGSACVLCGFA